MFRMPPTSAATEAEITAEPRGVVPEEPERSTLQVIDALEFTPQLSSCVYSRLGWQPCASARQCGRICSSPPMAREPPTVSEPSRVIREPGSVIIARLFPVMSL